MRWVQEVHKSILGIWKSKLIIETSTKPGNHTRTYFSYECRLTSYRDLRGVNLFIVINLGSSLSVQYFSSMIPRVGHTTVRRCSAQNWLRGLCHSLHLPHKFDAVLALYRELDGPKTFCTCSQRPYSLCHAVPHSSMILNPHRFWGWFCNYLSWLYVWNFIHKVGVV